MLAVITNGEANGNGTVGGAVRAKLVCGHHAWCSALAGREFPNEPLGGLGITAFLNEDFKYKAVLSHRMPQKVSLASDRDGSLVQRPLVTKAWGAPTD